MNNRITQLDSVRGLAALSVVFGHILLIVPPFLPGFLLASPIRILWAGHEAVIVFFILSGFVLSFSFFKKEKVNYKHFFIRRFCRIYLPYIVSVFFTLCIINIFMVYINEDIGWASNFWGDIIKLDTIFHHFLLITNFDTDTLNPVIWSLVQEMRISLIFPLIMFFVIKLSWKRSLFLAITISIVSISIMLLGLSKSEGHFTSYAYTGHYSAMFIVGALLAINREKIIIYYKKINILTKVIILIFGILLYTLQIGIGKYIHEEALLYFFRDWFTALGAVIFIVFSLASVRLKGLLDSKFIEFFGKISFSLYLYHLPVLFVTLYFFDETLPLGIVIILGISLTLIISYLSWKIVENASVKLGRTLPVLLEGNKKKNFKIN